MDYKDEHRAEEARELVSQCRPFAEKMRDRDLEFFEGVEARLDRYGDRTVISQAQLFWLRDIRDRYAL